VNFIDLTFELTISGYQFKMSKIRWS